MSESYESISRLSAWLRDYGDQSTPQFEEDVRRVLTLAKEAAELRDNLAKCRELVAVLQNQQFGDCTVDDVRDNWPEFQVAKEACGL